MYWEFFHKLPLAAIFQTITMNTVLTLLKEKVKASDTQIKIINLSREIRQALNTPPNTLIRDIRLLFNYTTPKSLLYLNRYCDIVLSRLITKKFLCPNYHHLYIRIADTKEDALTNIVIAEDWYIYGIAVLKEETLLEANQDEQQLLVLNAIKEGLLDKQLGF
jgi:disulfide oxidoreductase YuzD